MRMCSDFCAEFGDKMKDKLQFFKTGFDYVKSFAKWVIISALLGVVCGFVGSFFHMSIDSVTHFRQQNNYMIFLLPVGAVVICFLYKTFAKNKRVDTNRVLESVRRSKNVPFVMAPLIFVSTVISHAVGASAGREGAALQLGGSMGYRLGKILKMNNDDMHIIVMSGMSGLFSVLFGTPLTAAVFSMEVTDVGILNYSAFLPCIVSAFCALQVGEFLGITKTNFEIPNFSMDLHIVVKVVAISVLCALLSIVFCQFLHIGEKLSKKYFKNVYLRGVVGAVILVLLSLIVGCDDYNGAGTHIIERAIMLDAKPFAFALKILFTVITISAGFKGGEIVPTLFIGATFGNVIASLFGLNTTLGAAIGFVALFCGVVNCPIASILLALEVFGGTNVMYFALCVAISYMLSGFSSLYRSQKIMYSKTDAQYVNHETI